MTPDELDLPSDRHEGSSVEEQAEWHNVMSEALAGYEGLASVVFVRREADWYLRGFFWLEPAADAAVCGPARVAPLRTPGALWVTRRRLSEHQ
jgi:hypothetical protein